MISRNKQWNNVAKLEEWKALVDSTGTKGANLEDKFLFYVFAAFRNGLSLHIGNIESRKNIEQKFIFHIGTLIPRGISARFSFL